MALWGSGALGSEDGNTQRAASLAGIRTSHRHADNIGHLETHCSEGRYDKGMLIPAPYLFAASINACVHWRLASSLSTASHISSGIVLCLMTFHHKAAWVPWLARQNGPVRIEGRPAAVECASARWSNTLSVFKYSVHDPPTALCILNMQPLKSTALA